VTLFSFSNNERTTTQRSHIKEVSARFGERHEDETGSKMLAS
jgi:hypothetical protein